jgi:hypothetical protein
MPLISPADFAKSLNVSRQTVYNWKARGLLVLAGSKIDAEASKARLQEHLRDGLPLDTLDAKSAPPACQVDTLLTDSGETIAEAAARAVRESELLSTEEAKRLKENYLAKLAQLEYDTKSGRVVEAAEVAALVGAEYSRVRTKLLAIPAEQAPRIQRCRTTAEVQDTLREIITRILEELTADQR